MQCQSKASAMTNYGPINNTMHWISPREGMEQRAFISRSNMEWNWAKYLGETWGNRWRQVKLIWNRDKNRQNWFISKSDKITITSTHCVKNTFLYPVCMEMFLLTSTDCSITNLLATEKTRSSSFSGDHVLFLHVMHLNLVVIKASEGSIRDP